MNDLISRQAAINVVKGIDSHFVKYIEELPSAQPDRVFFVKTNRFLSFNEKKKLIEDLTLQYKNIVLLPEDCSLVYPVRNKGKWVKTVKHYKDDNMEFDFYAIECSVCGLPPEKAYHLTDYCPNCGARLVPDCT